MRRFRFVGLVVLLAVTAALVAQDSTKKDEVKKDDPIVIGKSPLPKFFRQLGLTDKQKADIAKAQASYAVKIKKLQDEIAALKAKEKDDLEALLTPAQKDRLKELRTGEKKDTPDKDKDKPKDTDKDKPKDK